MSKAPLSPHSEVVNEARRWTPDWYSWLLELTPQPGTVSGLPPVEAAVQGDRRFVTDATSTTFMSVVVGGGTNKVPVVFDGTDWRIG